MEKQKKHLFGITVKAVVVNEKNQVLMLKRPEKAKNGPGKWDLPGGKLESGENIIAGLKREIEEEIKLEVKVEKILYVFDFPAKYEENILVEGENICVNGKGLRFLVRKISGDEKISKEHEKFEWFSIDEAISKFGESDFEEDKKETLIRAKEYLEMKNSLDSLRRLAADFENYKKRQIENMKDTIAYSNANLILEILPVLDNFHASTGHIPEVEKNSPWVVGIMHIQKQLEKILEDNGVNEIKIEIGDEFNPEIMEAVENKEEKTGENKNIVKKIITKGYKINGRVIRAARVIVE